MLCLGRRENRKPFCQRCWAEAPVKIARMTLTAKLDGNWSSFQLANNTPPLSVTGSVIAPSARMLLTASAARQALAFDVARVFVVQCFCVGRRARQNKRRAASRGLFIYARYLRPSRRTLLRHRWEPKAPPKIREVTLMRPFHGNL